MRDVLERSLRFIHAKTVGMPPSRVGLTSPWITGVLTLPLADRIEMPISHAGGHGAGREDARPDEHPAIEINRGGVTSRLEILFGSFNRGQ